MINIDSLLIESAPDYVSGARFLKTKYQANKDRFISRFMKNLEVYLQMEEIDNCEDIVTFYTGLWDQVEEYSYLEAFKLEDDTFRAKVFSVINVPEMVKHLGTERIKTDGIDLINRVYDSYTNQFIEKSMTQIYELHKVNGEKLKLNEDIYAIKCWCTSTNEVHWLWIDSNMGKKNDPLEAIASTCKVYESMLNNIKHIIRQGDVFLFEMIDENITPKENEKVVSLDAKTYFKLLKSQS